MNEPTRAPNVWNRVRQADATTVVTWAALVATAFCAGVVIAEPQLVPSQDIPGHVAAVQVRFDPVHAGGAIAPNTPLTGWLFHYSACVLGGAGAESGVRRALLLWGVFGGWGSGRFARAMGGSSVIGAVVFGAAWAGWLLAMGFVNFSAAFALGMIGAGLLSDTEGRLRHVAAVLGSVLLVVAVFGHVIGGGMALAVAAVGVLAATTGRARWGRLLLLAPATASAAVVAFVSYRSGREAQTVETLQETVRQPVLDVLRDLVATPFVSWSVAGYALSVLLVVVAVLAPARTRTARVLRWALVPWLILYFALPLHGLGFAFAAPRVTIAIVLLLAATIDPARRKAVAVVAVACFAVTASAIPGAMAWGRRVGDAQAAFGERRPGFHFSVLLDDGARMAAPHANPYIGLSEYAGGVGSAAFSVNPVRDATLLTAAGRAVRPVGRQFAIHPACAAAGPECDAYERGLAQRVALQAFTWDNVVAVGTGPAFAEELARRGYRSIAERRWVPEPAHLLVRFDAPREDSVIAQLVWPEVGPVTQVNVVGDSAELGSVPTGPAQLIVGTVGGRILFSAPIDLRPGEDRVVHVATR